MTAEQSLRASLVVMLQSSNQQKRTIRILFFLLFMGYIYEYAFLFCLYKYISRVWNQNQNQQMTTFLNWVY